MELLNLNRGVLFDTGRRRNLRVKLRHGVGLDTGGGVGRQILESAKDNKADHHNGEGQSDAGQNNRPNVGVASFIAHRTLPQRMMRQMSLHSRSSLECHCLSWRPLE